MSWYDGYPKDTDDIYVKLKVYLNPSFWGIQNSRISKLFIEKRTKGGDYKEIFGYDRGTDQEITPEIQEIIDELLEEFPGQLEESDEK